MMLRGIAGAQRVNTRVQFVTNGFGRTTGDRGAPCCTSFPAGDFALAADGGNQVGASGNVKLITCGAVRGIFRAIACGERISISAVVTGTDVWNDSCPEQSQTDRT